MPASNLGCVVILHKLCQGLRTNCASDCAQTVPIINNSACVLIWTLHDSTPINVINRCGNGHCDNGPKAATVTVSCTRICNRLH